MWKEQIFLGWARNTRNTPTQQTGSRSQKCELKIQIIRGKANQRKQGNRTNIGLALCLGTFRDRGPSRKYKLGTRTLTRNMCTLKIGGWTSRRAWSLDFEIQSRTKTVSKFYTNLKIADLQSRASHFAPEHVGRNCKLKFGGWTSRRAWSLDFEIQSRTKTVSKLCPNLQIADLQIGIWIPEYTRTKWG